MSFRRTITLPLSVAVVVLPTLGCQRARDALCDCPPVEQEGSVEEALEEERYTLPGLEHGLVQSPVNILSDEAVEGKHHVALHFDHADPNFIENTGTTIELDFPVGSSITYDGKDYMLKQLHFHTPSEHQVDGITYPMEMHIVHKIDPTEPDDPPGYLVVGILFRMGKDNDFIGTVLDAVPVGEGHKELEPGSLYVDDLLHESVIPEYYHYRGSLTTPPHTETVEWVVLQDPMEASPEQIRRINLIEGDNARHIQALYGRPIED